MSVHNNVQKTSINIWEIDVFLPKNSKYIGNQIFFGNCISININSNNSVRIIFQNRYVQDFSYQGFSRKIFAKYLQKKSRFWVSKISMITECNCFIKSPNSLESFYIILLGIVLFSLVLVFSLSSCYGQCYNWIKVFKNGPSDKAAGCVIQGLLIGILFYSVPHFDVIIWSVEK